MSKRVAFITGSATGLGVQTVLHLAGQGHHIVIGYRESEEEARRLQEKVERLGVQTHLVQGDVSSQADCKRMVRQIIDRFHRVDILVNNAGPYIVQRRKLADYSAEDWHHMVEGNLSSVFFLLKEVVPYMRKNGWGRVITFGFNQASQANAWKYRAAYAAAKVGLVSLTKSIAQEECAAGITVNMICPGDILGDDKEKTIAEARQIEPDRPDHLAPIGRPGSGEDIARVVGFLCSEESDFVTGSVIEVNGGLYYTGLNMPEHKWKIEQREDDPPESSQIENPKEDIR